MSLIDTLMDLEDKLWKYKMSKTKKTYLTVKQIREKMKNNEPMPTNMFNATEKGDIVIPRTIYKTKVKTKRKKLF